ncbi:MAG TPA: hypothetical protein VKX39_09185 [Bryobacteraceae bacterium]|jgi:hypothetical protein|nr:hypothetical protein [Bryobacteraceae bacterium]
MTRRILFFTFAAILLIPGAQGKEQQDLRERVRDGVERTDKDIQNAIPREKLNPAQRERLAAALKDLREVREAVNGTDWQGKRDVLERAVENIDYLNKNAPIDEGDKQTLGIDLFTLRSILDSWKKP